jgi:EAL domain-containing protein (putative c-di-GMP-specific phosphodiesterase class I)
VQEVGEDPDASAIARAVITLGHSLGLKVVAEGAETESQIAFLRDNHCDYVQGFYFSKPLLADEFVVMLEEAGRGPCRVKSANRADRVRRAP